MSPALRRRRYEPVIGLEVHAQLLTRTKLFCACAATYGAEPNTLTCPVCLGLPGALPVVNAAAVELAARAGLALGCEVATRSVFARKSYFYPDLAKGYQISQLDQPLNQGGALTLQVDGVSRRVAIRRAHVEEDAAKSRHRGGPAGETLVDFNRAGVPLLEIVSEPELRSAAEAESYLRRLRELLMFAGVNDGNLEAGSFRCDANISMRPVGCATLGTRTELKNINSMRFVRRALEHEISRQRALLEAGAVVPQETRTWSEARQRTVCLRGKEEARDYRYLPDPDLPPLRLCPDRVALLRAALPRPPEARRAAWVGRLGLTQADAGVLSAHPALADFFEEAARAVVEAWGEGRAAEAGKAVANFVQAEVLRHVETRGSSARLPVSPRHLAQLVCLREQGVVSGRTAKEVFVRMVASGEAPRDIVEARGLEQLTDPARIRATLSEVLAAHPRQLAQLRAGREKLRGFFVGRVMRATGGKADPQLVHRLLGELIARDSGEEL